MAMPPKRAWKCSAWVCACVGPGEGAVEGRVPANPESRCTYETTTHSDNKCKALRPPTNYYSGNGRKAKASDFVSTKLATQA